MFDINTTNRSFIQLSNELESIGIRNCKWMLNLIDESLVGLLPHNRYLSRVDQYRVLTECLLNPLYFYREVYKFPLISIDIQSPLPFKRNNAAKLYCFLNDIPTIDLCGRQTFKTGMVLAKYAYLFLFGENLELLIQGKDLEDSKDRLADLSKCINILPDYIRNYKAHNSCKDTVNMIENTIYNNTIRIGRATKDTKESFISAARAVRKKDYIFINDLVYSDYFKDYYQTVLMNGNINSNIDIVGCAYETEYLEDIWKYAIHWDDSFYDKDIDEIKDMINNSGYNRILIHYEPEDIGIDVKEMYKLFLNDIETTRRLLSIHPYDKEYELIIDNY